MVVFRGPSRSKLSSSGSWKRSKLTVWLLGGGLGWIVVSSENDIADFQPVTLNCVALSSLPASEFATGAQQRGLYYLSPARGSLHIIPSRVAPRASSWSLSQHQTILPGIRCLPTPAFPAVFLRPRAHCPAVARSHLCRGGGPGPCLSPPSLIRVSAGPALT